MDRERQGEEREKEKGEGGECVVLGFSKTAKRWLSAQGAQNSMWERAEHNQHFKKCPLRSHITLFITSASFLNKL